MSTENKEVTTKTVKEKPKIKKTFDEEVRETIEAVVIAFILAFLFRTSVAEAFIIPTGSMATTLFGRHKDLTCPGCGYSYEVGASQELDESGYLVPEYRVDMSICPNCQCINRNVAEKIGYKGDRILVNKAAYQYMDPKRFDVIVFKYPMDPKTNYIKRLVGLPGETIMISRGNLYLKTNEGFQILRRPRHKQQIQELIVYDDRYPEEALVKNGWPLRWDSMEYNSKVDINEAMGGWEDKPAGWKRESVTGSTSYTLKLQDAQQNPDSWLRYRHLCPDPADWDNNQNGRILRPQPRLITDFCGYNNEFVSNRLNNPFDDMDSGMLWVSDLVLEAEVQFQDTQKNGKCIFEINKGVHHFQVSFNLANGEMTVSQSNVQNDRNDVRELGKFPTQVTANSRHHIKISNVDDEILVWIDDRQVATQGKTQYSLLETDNHAPTNEDFTPIGIKLEETGGTVSDLVINRDVYYQGRHIEMDISYSGFKKNLFDRINDPVRWYQEYTASMQQHDKLILTIGPTDYFVLGDNSPCSLDGRLWEGRQTVPQNALVGKAFFIYWPHGIPFGGENNEGFVVSKYSYRHFDGNKVVDKVSNYPAFSIPFYPDTHRMRWIR